MEFIVLCMVLGWIFGMFELEEIKKERVLRQKWLEEHPDYYDVLIG